MKNTEFRRKLVAAAVATALGIAAGSLQAAPYRGIFDPVDFEGEYTIDVDPLCLTLGDGWYANAGICAATLSSAIANVVSTSPDPVFTGTLTFAPPAISSSSSLFGLYVSGGKIDSFDTDLLYYQSATPSTSDDWWIQFVSGQKPNECNYCYEFIDFAPQVVELNPELKGVYLYVNDTGFPVAGADYIGPAERVPEPGTLSLVLGALGGGWLARRRRRKKEQAGPD